MNKLLLFITIFSFGYMFNDLVREQNLNFTTNANASVGGKNSIELARDQHFVDAVMTVAHWHCETYIFRATCIKPSGYKNVR